MQKKQQQVFLYVMVTIYELTKVKKLEEETYTFCEIRNSYLHNFFYFYFSFSSTFSSHLRKKSHVYLVIY